MGFYRFGQVVPTPQRPGASREQWVATIVPWTVPEKSQWHSRRSVQPALPLRTGEQIQCPLPAIIIGTWQDIV